LNVPEIEIDGLNLAYLDQGSGPPIVAIHGWGGNKNVWRPQIDPSRALIVSSPSTFRAMVIRAAPMAITSIRPRRART
jgi:pimeloyl-ACP methyl ester carboxylesterase